MRIVSASLESHYTSALFHFAFSMRFFSGSLFPWESRITRLLTTKAFDGGDWVAPKSKSTKLSISRAVRGKTAQLKHFASDLLGRESEGSNSTGGHSLCLYLQSPSLHIGISSHIEGDTEVSAHLSLASRNKLYLRISRH